MYVVRLVYTIMYVMCVWFHLEMEENVARENTLTFT